jgi:hypothetical protein
MVILPQIRPWRLLYALLDPWSYVNITTYTTMASFVRLKSFLVLWKYYYRYDHGVFCMPYLIPDLMEILLQIRPWRLLYILIGSWSYGNITTDKTMASFVHLKRFLVLWKYYYRYDHGVFCMPYLIPDLMEILLQIRQWRLLYILRGSWSYGNITTDKTMASFVCPT